MTCPGPSLRRAARCARPSDMSRHATLRGREDCLSQCLAVANCRWCRLGRHRGGFVERPGFWHGATRFSRSCMCTDRRGYHRNKKGHPFPRANAVRRRLFLWQPSRGAARGSAPLEHLEFFGTHRRLCDCLPNQYIHRTWFYDHFTHLAADTRDTKIELVKGMKVGVEDFVRGSRAHGDKANPFLVRVPPRKGRDVVQDRQMHTGQAFSQRLNQLVALSRLTPEDACILHDPFAGDHSAKFDPDFAQQQISTTRNDGMDLPNQNLHQFPLQHRKAVAEILSCTWLWCCVVSCRRSPC